MLVAFTICLTLFAILHTRLRPFHPIRCSLTCCKTVNKILETILRDVLRDPLNSSDVAPWTYHLFRFVQKTISGESSYAEVKNELDDWIVSKQLDFCGIRLLLDRWTHLVTSFLNECTLNKSLCYFYKKEVSFLYTKKGAVLYIPLIE